MEKLFSMSDVVSLHVPEVASTKYMMAAQEVCSNERGRISMNTARVTVVDISALCNALRSKKLASAIVDVFPTESK